jgi:hypothetical protein
MYTDTNITRLKKVPKINIFYMDSSRNPLTNKIRKVLCKTYSLRIGCKRFLNEKKERTGFLNCFVKPRSLSAKVLVNFVNNNKGLFNKSSAKYIKHKDGKEEVMLIAPNEYAVEHLKGRYSERIGKASNWRYKLMKEALKTNILLTIMKKDVVQ